MQPSAISTSFGIARSPAIQRRTVRPSTPSWRPASSCDQPSAAMAAANSAGGTDDVVRASGLSLRTAQGWMSERFTPSAATLLRMADRNDKLRRELLARLAHMEAERNGGTQARGVSLDGGAPVAPGGAADRPRDAVASEG